MSSDTASEDVAKSEGCFDCDALPALLDERCDESLARSISIGACFFGLRCLDDALDDFLDGLDADEDDACATIVSVSSTTGSCATGAEVW